MADFNALLPPPIELDGASIAELATHGNDAHGEGVVGNWEEEHFNAPGGGIATAQAVVVNVREENLSSESQNEPGPVIANEARNIPYNRPSAVQNMGRSQRRYQRQSGRLSATLRQSHSSGSFGAVDHEIPGEEGSGREDDRRDEFLRDMNANLAERRDERPAERSLVSLNESIRLPRRDEVPEESRGGRFYERATQRPDRGLEESFTPPPPQRSTFGPNEGLPGGGSDTPGQLLATIRAEQRDSEGFGLPRALRPAGPENRRSVRRRQDDLVETGDESPQDQPRPPTPNVSRLVVAVDYGTTYSGVLNTCL
jgi:hypothetical protein